ncbi:MULTISPECIES: DUF3017 domain-containing protein [Streptomyces]|uniref:DUF3017 domain-containing protein n=1 Tax=Streptomyces anulatus TaxID=1892 RepID=A0A7K3RKY0_STRAQ|nr:MULTISPECIES: DUF3017 domain-containing protein [Streptomyces]NDZ57918.1 DUF3017 domain-containing protein [Streptomyces anulatus]NEC02840.1 DUF3017 domain-containing protein [Streptomyces anulatus]OLO31360.1 hypothetical protein PZ61_0212955 [Streptomyces sp. MNU77]OWA24022.1 hypothetical protein B9W61_13620 [Streptomyces sp. CS057]
MGAGTSPADPAPAGRAADEPREPGERDGTAGTTGSASPDPATDTSSDTAMSTAATDTATSGSTSTDGATAAADTDVATDTDTAPSTDTAEDGAATGGRPRRSRRFPRFTRDTARPEGGGRAASGDAPAPARQWPLLTVLGAAGLGLLIVVLDPFDQAFRIGTILIGGALIAGAVLRWVVPSVGMLAVRSRFTDLVTYGLMGTLIVLLALVAQPAPWLDVPILEDAVRFTIR